MLESWVKSIVVFVLFSSMVFFLLPDETYRKYMQQTVGCVLAILVITPVLQADGIDDVPGFIYYQEERQAAVSVDDRQYYTDVMEALVEDYIKDTWNVQAQATLAFDESDQIKRMDVSVQEEVEAELLEELRQGLISGYAVSEDAVSVTKDAEKKQE